MVLNRNLAHNFQILEQNYAKTEMVGVFDIYESLKMTHCCSCEVLLKAVIESQRLTLISKNKTTVHWFRSIFTCVCVWMMRLRA